MEDIVVPSPDRAHTAVMKYVGEIRFGPAYYSLALDQRSFGERVFGKSCLWSPDSRYFAAQEWETMSESDGPRTRLLLIGLLTERQCVLSRAEKGFIVPKKFEAEKLIYTKEYYDLARISEFEIEFLSLDRWEKIT
jgi:hypothetical protein